MSDTPTCFFLKPSFQSAYIAQSSQHDGVPLGYIQRRTLATLFAPPFLGVAAAPPFLPAFLEGAWISPVSEQASTSAVYIADHYASEGLET